MQMEFEGITFDPKLDGKRLTSQLECVKALMLTGRWWTLSELVEALPMRASEAGVSARLRDLRKTKFGSYNVERRRRGDPKNGLWEYRINMQ